jgi:hypothetical protein
MVTQALHHVARYVDLPGVVIIDTKNNNFKICRCPRAAEPRLIFKAEQAEAQKVFQAIAAGQPAPASNPWVGILRQQLDAALAPSESDSEAAASVIRFLLLGFCAITIEGLMAADRLRLRPDADATSNAKAESSAQLIRRAYYRTQLHRTPLPTPAQRCVIDVDEDDDTVLGVDADADADAHVIDVDADEIDVDAYVLNIHEVDGLLDDPLLFRCRDQLTRCRVQLASNPGSIVEDLRADSVDEILSAIDVAITMVSPDVAFSGTPIMTGLLAGEFLCCVVHGDGRSLEVAA